ncbi:DMT family transporter [Peribacillus sp. SCS-155]|uniref:DMT family transporter n=1 Tax=Peribacillus sedimenti TaxID=3115297 RepID=UPI003906B82B
MAKNKGYVMVLTAAALWGISGTAAQHLFDKSTVTMGWLVTVRLLASGLLFLIMAALGGKSREVFTVWRNTASISHFVFFGIAGMMGVQYTYFAAIDTGNAAVATLLQYIAPVIILAYYLLRQRSIPNRLEIIAVILALWGTVLLLTNGKPETLAVPWSAVGWGLLSAFALAFYTLYSNKLVQKFNSVIVVGWGMLFGGISLIPVYKPYEFDASEWNVSVYLLIVFVIIFGTLIPFYLFIDSLHYITPKEGSLLSCAEPLSSVITSIIWLGVPFGIFQGAGALSIIGMVILLTLKPNIKKGAPAQHSAET